MRQHERQRAEEEESHEWTASQWLASLHLHEVLITAFDLPAPGAKQFNYVKKLSRADLEEMLSKDPRDLDYSVTPLEPQT